MRKSIKVWPSEQPRLRRSIARIEGQNQAWTAQIPYAHWWSQCHQNFRPHGTSGVLHRRYQARKSKFLWNIHLLGTRSHHGNISSGTFCLRQVMIKTEMGQLSTKTNACTHHFLLPHCDVAVTLWRASAKC